MTNNRKNYRLDVDKIKTLQDVKNVFDSIRFIGYYDADDPEDENYYLSEYFTIPQEPQELTIPAPRKSIDEITQEFDEKIDKLIENTKNKFHQSKHISERLYDTKLSSIIWNFEYAKEHGEFRPKLIFTYGTGLSAGSYVSYVIKQGNNHKGYYTFGDKQTFKYYTPDKPNRLVKFFMKTCLSLVWIDEKDT